MGTMEDDFRKMNSDGYEEQYKQCSHYEMPREPKFSPEKSILTRTICNIPTSSVKPLESNGNRTCDTCNKEDVCMYKEDLVRAAKEINQILDRKNVFIDTDIRCKK